jgi:hypothetical protein
MSTLEYTRRKVGWAIARAALYLAALCGRRWNPALRPFYERPEMLTILNAMVRDNAYWRAPGLRLEHSC